MTFNQCHVKTRIGNLAVLCYCSKLVELALDHIFKTSATTKEKARDLSSLISVFALLLQIGVTLANFCSSGNVSAAI